MSISTTAISVSFHHHHVRSSRPFTFFPCRAPSRYYSSQFPRLAAGSVSNSGESEESRWLREEQRWLREEQRWLRQESRWISERESLLSEISSLRAKVQESELECRNSLSDNSQSAVSLPSTQSDPLVLPSPPSSYSSLSAEVISPEVIEKQEVKDNDLSKLAKVTIPKRKALWIGIDGEEVREMQEALLKLGFYSGEEEMEFSTFSTRTHRAVKTWQATIGVPEDGIMTEELLNRLYISSSLGNANEASFTSVIENTTEIQQTVVKKERMTELEASHRVFLIGENRWEEPSRLVGNDKQAPTSNAQDSSRRCLTCRGEGRLLCTDCDGTGEPNIEPQFLEWVDEGAKCPYCEGLGYTVCDSCIGKSTV